MPYRKSWLPFLILLLAALACNLPTRSLPAAPETASPLPALPALPDTSTPTIGPCGFNWARESLPDVSEKLVGLLKEAQLPVESAVAEAYGENCIYEDGSVAYFAAMETDYSITLNVPTLDDKAALGELLGKVLTTLQALPVGSTPGPNPGYIGVTFQAGEQSERLWFERRRAEEALQQGLTGEQLYKTLQVK